MDLFEVTAHASLIDGHHGFLFDCIDGGVSDQSSELLLFVLVLPLICRSLLLFVSSHRDGIVANRLPILVPLSTTLGINELYFSTMHAVFCRASPHEQASSSLLPSSMLRRKKRDRQYHDIEGSTHTEYTS